MLLVWGFFSLRDCVTGHLVQGLSPAWLPKLLCLPQSGAYNVIKTYMTTPGAGQWAIYFILSQALNSEIRATISQLLSKNGGD